VAHDLDCATASSRAVRRALAGGARAYDQGVGQWWYDNIVEPGKQPLLCCLLAFVLTFLITRAITRMIRAGVGPFRNNVSASGVHVHHAVPGIILLIIGALVALRSDEHPWQEVAGVMIGIGMSLILDEFALILHLQDVYWAKEGRVSVELVGLTAATLGLLMIGFSPFGVDDLTIGDFSIRIGLISGVALHGLLILVCVLKGKYRAALISCFLPLIAWVLAIRLARPTSWWGRKFYGPQRATRALERAEKFDRRWDPRWAWLSDLIAGSPTLPDPPPAHPVLAPPPHPTREDLPQPGSRTPH
jgi:hypothetical protein